MTLKSLAIKAGIATATVAAMGLVAATPASAHTNNMYTYVGYNDTNQQAYFATYGKTDGVVTALPTSFVAEEMDVLGIEVVGEKGTSIGTDGDRYVREWNHTTGARGPQISVFLNTGGLNEFQQFVGLDTLNDGTTVTLVRYLVPGDGEPLENWAIASVNSGTGELIPLTVLTDEISGGGDILFEPTSLATDPATGITYVFLQGPDGTENFVPVTVATDTVDDITLLGNAYFVEGYVNGVDFDQATGELYFNNYNDISVEEALVKFTGGPSTWSTAAPVYISAVPANGVPFVENKALTIEYTALAATGSELPVVAWLLVGTVAVLAGGVTVMVARRRSEAGTV